MIPAHLTRYPAVAKLNLFLHINEQLPNGYHSLQSVFQLLDQGDDLGFELRQDNQIVLKTPIKGVKDEDNLIVKAAKLLQQHMASSAGCDIYLDKKLPMGGGIGGGSSNAATVLLVLNKLWQCGLSEEQLAQLGVKLGADVPIFIKGESSFAQGIGEQLQPIELPEQFYLVANPGVHVSTADVFQLSKLPRNTKKIAPTDYTFDSTRNDCEKIVCERHPQVANLLQWLVEYAPSRMTGTGACVFAVFASAEDAQKVLKQLPEHCHGFVAKGMQRSPLQTLLDELY